MRRAIISHRKRSLTTTAVVLFMLWATGLSAFTIAHGDDPVDSLHQVISTAKHDTTRLTALMALCEIVSMDDPDTNLIICNNAIADIVRNLAKPSLGAREQRTFHRLHATALNNKAVSHFIYGELDSALFLFEQAEALYTIHGPAARVADALNNQSLIQGVMGHHAEQRKCLFSALAIYQREGDMINAGIVTTNIGNYYRERGVPDSASIFFRKALETLLLLGDERGIANATLNLGQWLIGQGQHREGFELLLDAEERYVATNDLRGLATCLNNIGNLQMNLGLTTEAIDYFHRALDINASFGDFNGRATLLMNIGSLLLSQGLHELARKNYLESLSMYEQVNDISGVSIVQANLGDVMKGMGDMAAAQGHFEASIRAAQEAERPEDIANSLYKLGHFLEDQGALDTALILYRQGLDLDLGGDPSLRSYSYFSIAGIMLKQGKSREAITNARTSLQLAQEVGYPAVIQRAAKVLHEALVAQGQWPEATAMLKLHYQMKDSMESAELGNQVLRTQLQYVFERKQMADSLAHLARVEEVEHERTLATIKSAQARNRSLAVGGSAFLLLATGGLYYRQDRKRRQERHDRKAAELQMRLLRAQMNPHFLFNALNSLHVYIQDNDRELAAGFLSKFTRLMRLVLEHSQHSEISLTKDLEALRLYLDLEQVRMNGKFDYTITVEPDLDPDTTLVPPLVLQPFVENAIWHGVSRKEGQGHIDVRIAKADALITILVEDDGVGRGSTAQNNVQDPTGKTSLGTNITRDRLALLGNRLGSAAGFRYRERDHGTSVEVYLPLMQDA